MSDIDAKRAYVADLYPGPGWKQKVKKMPDSQILAIYLKESTKASESSNNKPKESGEDDIPF